jgi:[CysO sulfur-carrier protein]-S-L-cysteine hydrolase
MRMTTAQWEELIAHAGDDAPNECCGYLRIKDGAVDGVVRAQNDRKSPYGYEMDYESKREAAFLEDDGYDVAIYHSHPRSEAEPSQTDINLAKYSYWLHVIISLKDEPSVRAWRIRDGHVEEEPIIVE